MFNKDVKRSDFRISFGSKYVFMKLGLILLIVLKIFIAKVCNLLISIVEVFLFFDKVE